MLQEPPIGEAPLVQGKPTAEEERQPAKPGKKQQRKRP
jgi:hypothetical protein